MSECESSNHDILHSRQIKTSERAADLDDPEEVARSPGTRLFRDGARGSARGLRPEPQNRGPRDYGQANTRGSGLRGRLFADLAAIGRTLREATDFYLAEHRRPPAPSGAVLAEKVLAEYERRVEAREVSRRHLETFREVASKFRAEFDATPIDKIRAGEVKRWLGGLPLAIKTRNKLLGYVGAMFRLAVGEWNLIEKNPLAGVAKFSDPHSGRRVSVFTPEEMGAVLSAVTPDWLPVFAINAFTGLRRAEIERMIWSEIKLDRRLIDLPFTKSKNGRRKLITIPENLARMLAPVARSEGPVAPNRRFDLEVRRLKTLGLKWPPNVLRHSFCSYAVAVHGFVWTAREADHSETVLKKHYREVVTAEDARRYWEIVPGGCGLTHITE